MEPYRNDAGRYYARKIFHDDPDDDNDDDDDSDLGRPSSKPEPSAPPFGKRPKDQYSFEPSAGIRMGSPSQRRSSEYNYVRPRVPTSGTLKEAADVMQFVSTYALETAGRRGAELSLGRSASMGGKVVGEKRPSSAYEVACDMRRREYEVGPNNKVVKIVDTDLNFRVTLLEEPNNYIRGKSSVQLPAPTHERSSTYSSSGSSTCSGSSGRRRTSTSRLVTATCPFCCREDEFERRFLNGTVTCERCLRNFFLEEDSTN